MQARTFAHFASWRSVFCALTLGSLLLASASTAVAAPITYNYGSRAGSTVDFLGISETPILASAADQFAHFNAISPTDGPFGAPAKSSGDSLLFNPATFSLSVVGPLAGPPAWDLLDSQLNFTIQAKTGYGIDAFAIQEAGDVFFTPGATKASWAEVAAAVNVSVTEIDGKAISPIFVPAANAIFIPTGAFNAASNPLSTIWTGNGYIDISAYLLSQSILGTATRIDVALDNTLVAGSGNPNKIAKIQKKLFDGTSVSVVTTPGNPVPEPSSLVLAAMGILGAGWYGRRNLRRK